GAGNWGLKLALEAVPSTSAVDPPPSWLRSRARRSPDMVYSPEVLDQHQVVGRGIQAGIENRFAVGRRGQPCPNLTEVASNGRGVSGREVEILKPCFASEPVDIIGAVFEQPEIKPNDPVERLDRLAAGSRQAPQGRYERKLQVV